MAIKKLLVLLSYAAVFAFTFSVSIVAAQIVGVEKSAQSDSLFPTGVAGVWRFNEVESDDVLTKIGELLKSRDDAPINEKSEAKESEQQQPALSISLFAPDALILLNGDAGEMTVDEIFKTVVETRIVALDGTLREYEIVPGAKIAITATRQTDGLTIETVSPRGNLMTETFRLASGGAKLIVVVRIEHSDTGEVLNLRRVYNREQADTSFVAE